MENPEVSQPENEPYMRKYMRERYKQDPIKARQYRRSCRVRALKNVPEADVQKYGRYLADIFELREIIARIPKEYVQEIVASI
jgi:hypothetical protein